MKEKLKAQIKLLREIEKGIKIMPTRVTSKCGNETLVLKDLRQQKLSLFNCKWY
jgi:hypothetical protein